MGKNEVYYIFHMSMYPSQTTMSIYVPNEQASVCFTAATIASTLRVEGRTGYSMTATRNQGVRCVCSIDTVGNISWISWVGIRLSCKKHAESAWRRSDVHASRASAQACRNIVVRKDSVGSLWEIGKATLAVARCARLGWDEPKRPGEKIKVDPGETKGCILEFSTSVSDGDGCCSRSCCSHNRCLSVVGSYPRRAA